MSTGLLALLDDVVALAKAAAVSVDDVAAMSAKAGTKSMGVVIDDAAVTPRYAVGFAPARELPIIWRIAKGSLRNKLLVLLPGALFLSLVAPWSITPILMLGGAFLCFEGAEKVLEYAGLRHHDDDDDDDEADEAKGAATGRSSKTREDRRVASAIKTDLILSAEIMAITLAGLPEIPFWQQAVVLGVVGVGITALVYGAVAVIVKADDVGLAMATRDTVTPLGPASQALGRGIVKAMPGVLKALAAIGTVAMLWVGGGIILHGLEVLGVAGPAHVMHDISEALGHTVQLASGAVAWIAGALGSALAGLALGLIIIPVATRVLVPLVARVRGT